MEKTIIEIKIISDIITENIIKNKIRSACIPISIVFSKILDDRGIKNIFNRGYINIHEKYSMWHCWISIDNIIHDIAYDSYKYLLPDIYTNNIVYSKDPLFEVIDEDNFDDINIKNINNKIIDHYELFPNDDIFIFMENIVPFIKETKKFINDIYHIFKINNIEIIHQKKIYSYIQQDKKTLFMCKDTVMDTDNELMKINTDILPSNYIDINDVKILLDIQEYKCYICKEKVKIDYKPGCKYQFTLDRINSDNPHLKGNCLIACWYCNCIDFNSQRNCKEKCCPDKSKDLRRKEDVPDNKINKINKKYNKLVNGDYSPYDEWNDIDVNNVQHEFDKETEGYKLIGSDKEIRESMKCMKIANDQKMESYYPGYKNMSRRERKNLTPPNDFEFEDEIWGAESPFY